MNQKEILIIGSNGQLGTALKTKYPRAVAVDYEELDITSLKNLKAFDWSRFKIILNAAAYTNVDSAETNEGRIAAWKINANGPANLAEIASEKGLILLHISTDYVFDGMTNKHNEDESFSPLGVYGSSKAAGDLIVSSIEKHYILRTSWVIGEGKNFVRTMIEIGRKGIHPSVVSDQIGRLTFTSELVRAIDFLISNNSDFGTYNLSNDGKENSWADITRKIFKEMGVENIVNEVTTEEYYNNKNDIARRPLKSTLNLGKIQGMGFKSKTWEDELLKYINEETAK
jgi:dTDP-4-dehydrorhamnose 3,5-epimerase/reductase